MSVAATPERPAGAWSRRIPLAGALLLVFAATVFAYWPNLSDYFSTDDFLILAPARRLPAGSFIWNTFLLRGPVPFWRPLLAPIYVVETWLFGLHPLPYHLVNLGLHLLITFLLFRLVLALTGSELTGIVAALLFGVSPTYAGSVAWMATLNELTAITCYLFTLVLVVHAVQHHRHSLLFWGAGFLACILALLAWEAAITVTVVVVFVCFLERGLGQHRWRRFIAEVVPFILLAGGYAVFNWIAQVRQANDRLLVYGIGSHIFPHYWWYLGRLVLPVPDNAGSWVPDARGVGAAILLLACAVAAVRGSWATRMAVVWLLVSLLPFTLWIIWTGDRWTYTASLPLAMFLAIGLVKAFHSLFERQLPVALCLAMAAFVFLPSLLVQAKIQQDHSLTLGAAKWHSLLSTLTAEYPALPAHSTIYLVNGPFTDLFDGSYLQNIGELLYGNVQIFDVDGVSYAQQGLAERPNSYALIYRNGEPYTMTPPPSCCTSARRIQK